LNRIGKKEKANTKKNKVIKLILIILILIIIISAIKTGIFIVNWQNMAKDMISNSPSQVLDTDGRVIAEL